MPLLHAAVSDSLSNPLPDLLESVSRSLYPEIEAYIRNGSDGNDLVMAGDVGVLDPVGPPLPDSLKNTLDAILSDLQANYVRNISWRVTLLEASLLRQRRCFNSNLPLTSVIPEVFRDDNNRVLRARA